MRLKELRKRDDGARGSYESVMQVLGGRHDGAMKVLQCLLRVRYEGLVKAL